MVGKAVKVLQLGRPRHAVGAQDPTTTRRPGRHRAPHGTIRDREAILFAVPRQNGRFTCPPLRALSHRPCSYSIFSRAPGPGQGQRHGADSALALRRGADDDCSRLPRWYHPAGSPRAKTEASWRSSVAHRRPEHQPAAKHRALFPPKRATAGLLCHCPGPISLCHFKGSPAGWRGGWGRPVRGARQHRFRSVEPHAPASRPNEIALRWAGRSIQNRAEEVATAAPAEFTTRSVLRSAPAAAVRSR